MLSTAIVLALVATPKTLNILFLGNSHTAFNNVPALVDALIESDGSGRKVATLAQYGGFLNDIALNPQVIKEIESKRWNVVVLQAAKLSNSHKYQYSHQGGIDLAKLAKKNGAQALLFAEWPRKGWKETDYILSQYQMIAKPSGARIVPICVAWDAVLRKHSADVFWSSDGNHAQPAGSFIAAACIATWLADSNSKLPAYNMPGIDQRLSGLIKRTAQQVVNEHR